MIEKIKKFIPRKIFRYLQAPYHFLMSFMAALFFGFPSRRLIVIGVTGTAGKTSTVYMIAKMLNEAGYKTGFTSTTIFSDGQIEKLNDKKMTMPGRLFIQKMLRNMVKNKCTYAVIETTSEGIKQFRHRFINYDTLVFTGLYPEHIESHGSFKKYKEAKGELFSHLKRFKNKYINDDHVVCRAKTGLKKLDLKRVKKTIIVNHDDEAADYFLSFWSEAKILFSLNPNSNPELRWTQLNSEALVKDLTVVRGEILSSNANGLDLQINNEQIHLLLLGDFNAANALSAYSVGLAHDLNHKQMKAGLEKIKALAGKMELIAEGQNFIAMVDYSFEPKALEKLYQTLELFSYDRLIHVLGSTGGGRDQDRRPILGRLAAAKADIVIITNEDPYDEDEAEIINQVAKGAEMSGKIKDFNLFKILDRREAMKKAVELARNGDFVLVTGKGAEQYICVAEGKKIPWDDRLELKQAIVDKMCVDKK